MINPYSDLKAKEALKGRVKTILIGLVLVCILLNFWIQSAKKEAAKRAEQEQPKQDTTAKTETPIAFIKQDTIIFDLERIGELDKVDTLILEGIEALEERLNNELEVK